MLTKPKQNQIDTIFNDVDYVFLAMMPTMAITAFKQILATQDIDLVKATDAFLQTNPDTVDCFEWLSNHSGATQMILLDLVQTYEADKARIEGILSR